jgi:hypothetical protein
MTHHQRINGDVDFSDLDIPGFLLRDREKRGVPTPTLARAVCSNKATFKPDPMELSRVMAADYSPPFLLRKAVIRGVLQMLVAGCVLGTIGVTYHYIAHMWPH